ncbi:SDR family NAD(P)-dependent oxidoreductase [Bacillus sp. ISL-18]|uniref:SDR family NAD(P)-dependent oxidoreductase n=1 Tax=Bacillus sp. ISL-18 TaxID=2819118 RepID=UPI001BE9B322|nr:SDR family NAD(P)-dependent oxidoreductase [Bacillus sp. ISL-18]MBT2655504.1 SDR family NAD(P)-dependent oxidoreductase [Bacillus sp. ISL-18]
MSSQSQAYLLEGRVAVVTGSFQGIRKAVAIGLSQAGATVLVTGTNFERSQEVSEDVDQLTGRETDYFIGDLSKDENVIQMVEEPIHKWEKIESLVNNAG